MHSGQELDVFKSAVMKENSGSLINNLKMTNNENINIIARKLEIKITFK